MMPEPQKYIVGRQSEVEQFAALLDGRTKHWLLNIFGPGGIGKTVVGTRMLDYAQKQGVPAVFVDGIDTSLTPDRIMHAVQDGLTQAEPLEHSFSAFEKAYDEYLIVQEVLQRGGGVQAMFDVVGNVKDPGGFAKVIGSLGKGINETVQRTVSNRFALERYLRGVDRALTDHLKTGLEEALEISRLPLTLILDTYEELEGLDDWICRALTPTLPEGIKVVVLGRNSLPRVNFDWQEYGDALHSMELPELPEGDAKAYLVHFGLRDQVMQDQIYRFTGGYPLLLVLVRHLAKEAGGWDKVGDLKQQADRDSIATQLLNRILREERVNEVRAFLEKGVVARWFDPETIRVILEADIEQARDIYDKLSRHSFVEKHPYGLKFHDKIRELLLGRLKFTSETEYQRISQNLMNYYAEQAGIEPLSDGEE